MQQLTVSWKNAKLVAEGSACSQCGPQWFGSLDTRDSCHFAQQQHTVTLLVSSRAMDVIVQYVNADTQRIRKEIEEVGGVAEVLQWLVLASFRS